jgi:hypothetical protein
LKEGHDSSISGQRYEKTITGAVSRKYYWLGI